jgi:hypothetical protein
MGNKPRMPPGYLRSRSINRKMFRLKHMYTNERPMWIRVSKAYKRRHGLSISEDIGCKYRYYTHKIIDKIVAKYRAGLGDKNL